MVKFVEEATALAPRVEEKTPEAAWERLCDKLVSILVQKPVVIHVEPLTWQSTTLIMATDNGTIKQS